MMSHVTPPPMDMILQVQRDGIAAVAEVTGRFNDDEWSRQTPCDAWTALELSGHVITAAMMWHEALDDAHDGVSTPRWRFKDLSRHNEEYLAALPDASGGARIEDFVDRANRWCDRVSETDPDLLFPAAIQDVCATPLTVGLFAWFGGVEFHLHAWDFAQTIGEDYRSPHAQTILDAVSALFGSTIDDGDPWDQIIRRFRT